MRTETWRASLSRRAGWSLGAASVWTWGLLLLRMVRDGWQPLEVWFGYSLSFFMTTVYVYLGLLIWATVRAEGRRPEEAPLEEPRLIRALARARRPLALVGVAGLVAAVGSLAGWLALRYPGPQAVPGTQASVLLGLMILGVAVIATLIARGAR
jgi:hypothetical protein